MKHANPLDTLIEQSRQARDRAGKQLAEDRSRERSADRQLDTLRQYKSEYQSRMRQAMAAGIDVVTLDNFHRFIGSLDDAIVHADDQLTDSRHRVDASRNQWQQKQRKLSSYDTLAQRRAARRREQEKRHEQRRSDDINTTAQARKQCARDRHDNSQESPW